MTAIDVSNQTQPYPTVATEADDAGNEIWMYMHADNRPGIRPCFRTELMMDMHAYLASVAAPHAGVGTRGLRHLVIASAAPAFNLGGDLELFGKLIRSGNRAELLAYAQSCVEGVYQFHTGLGGDFRTIALVQGDALGGGLELALSCHDIVAEQGVDMGLPEVLFGLFPGMGAYSFLSRRIGPHAAERMILEGRLYTSDELHAMGVVDVLVPKGQGPQAVRELIRQQQRAPHAHRALNRVRALSQPVAREELMAITETWVDTALQLGDRSLRTMERIVRAQARRGTNLAG
ncbi:crotonase/enoyl-CoA hydratase family protein [Aerolutibacter ruishenii]|uniref:DSF synthase n=1 Tax=Aerolutibacter ruishenii TaxID=686800 RepID=A0A562LYV6_9GAMM|nr:crotonase/enoyl-CoA hydratase family protein [Lysobacter ruishenii]TWI12742.1 DSF synthase [Lysobacter ruishenii]